MARIKLPKAGREGLVQERNTGQLVRSCYRWLEKQGRLRARELAGLTKLTWITVSGDGGEPAPNYERKTTIPALKEMFGLHGEYQDREEVADALPTTELRMLARKRVGIVNLFPAYRGTYTDEWVPRHVAAIKSMCTAATRFRTDEDRIAVARQMDMLAPVPRVGGGPLRSSSALSPLICCLDPGRRFPIVNKAQPVIDLLAMRGIHEGNTVRRVEMMLGLIGHYGIVDAFFLDAAAMNNALGPLRAVIRREVKNEQEGLGSDVRIPGGALPTLGWEDEEASRFSQKAKTVTVRKIHRKMTNALRKLLVPRYTVKRGPRGPAQFDVLVKSYQGHERDLLIEVKSIVDVNAVRLAVGQLLDYRRSLNRDSTDLAVMLPSVPTKPMMEFLADVPIKILWFGDKEFTHVVGDWKCP